MTKESRNLANQIDGIVVAETEKALLIKFKSWKQVWIPKSTIHSNISSDNAIFQAFLIDT